MRHLFDFGVSQEDPLTENSLLQPLPGGRLLCVASGGEIPLTLACLHPGTSITAVDISENQLRLCRLKLQTALALPFPLNASFLGYSRGEGKQRIRIYQDIIRPFLHEGDQAFWDEHLRYISAGVVNTGRFELYLRRPRRLAQWVIGKKNLDRLMNCETKKEQEEVFDRYIARRRLLKWVFAIAFHPRLYRKRGLRSEALRHAGKNTGEKFFDRFRSFCTATPANRNYFFQYFLLGECMVPECIPEYLQPRHHAALLKTGRRIRWKCAGLREELAAEPAGTYSRIHLSNIGDWMEEADFRKLIGQLERSCDGGTRLCYRFLQKNHLEARDLCGPAWEIHSVPVEHSDRFPFYSVLTMEYHG